MGLIMRFSDLRIQGFLSLWIQGAISRYLVFGMKESRERGIRIYTFTGYGIWGLTGNKDKEFMGLISRLNDLRITTFSGSEYRELAVGIRYLV